MQTYQRPPTFQAGKDYFLRAPALEGVSATPFIPVTFLAYDPCPAFIIIRANGKPHRCSRDDLFILTEFV